MLKKKHIAFIAVAAVLIVSLFIIIPSASPVQRYIATLINGEIELIPVEDYERIDHWANKPEDGEFTQNELTEEQIREIDLANADFDPLAALKAWDGTGVDWEGMNEDPAYYSFGPNVSYISCEEYLAKHEIRIKKEKNLILSKLSLGTLNEIREGIYSGMEILGVSDLPIDHPYFIVKCVSPIKHIPFDFPEMKNSFYDEYVNRSYGIQSSNFNLINNIRGVPDSDVQSYVETNAGPYYYRYSLPYDQKKGTSMSVGFYNTEVKYSGDPKNAYVFTTLLGSSTSYDFGIFTAVAYDRRDHWTAFASYGGALYAYNSNTYISANYSDTVNNIYRFTGSLNIGIALDVDYIWSGKINGTYITGGSVPTSMYNYNAPVTFINAVSFIDGDGYTNMNTGAHFQTVELSNCKLYSGYSFSGTTTNFYAYSNYYSGGSVVGPTYYSLAHMPGYLDFYSSTSNPSYEEIGLRHH